VYDDVDRDGGATASYIFWVLDYLGHESVRVLDGGVEAWQRAGFDTTDKPTELEPVTYQVAPEEIQRSSQIVGAQLYERLGDRYYQVLDVRSRDEYLGEAPNAGWEGKALKLGHVPGAFNVNYENNWAGAEQKPLKSYAQLQQLYAGLDPSKAVVTYCHSGRRSSHTYFVLRLMGFSDVRLYDESWNEWGNKWLYYPIETKENILRGTPVQAVSMSRTGGRSAPQTGGMQPSGDSAQPSGDGGNGGGQSSYISCGG
jgi:thiosulfate/3-mercaptopyruvate sulfurtransferase